MNQFEQLQKMMLDNQLIFAEHMLEISKGLKTLTTALQKQNEMLKPFTLKDKQELKTLTTLGTVSRMYQEGKSRGRQGRALFNNIQRKAGKA